MKVYQLKKKQQLNTTIEKAWEFFSSPKNLKKITPDYLGFKILSEFHQEKMYPGQLINYIVKPIAGIPMRWTTEITHVDKHIFFVDEQRFGPYAMWHHQHWFEENREGVLMTDIVDYALPFGFIGRLFHPIIVKPKLEEIFKYRSKITEELFN